MLPVLPTTVKTIVADLLRAHPELADRLGRAVSLIEAQRFTYSHHDAKGAPVYLMSSSQGDGKVYVVEAGACTCPARGLCYHRLARRILAIRTHNQTEVEWGDALALEDQPTPPPAPPSLPTVEEQRSPFLAALERAPEGPSKRVILAGVIRRGVTTIKTSMVELGEHLRASSLARPSTAKLH